MKTKVRSSLVTHAFAVMLLLALALFTAGLHAPAQTNVTVSTADFQRLVYSAHLHTQLALKPELEACLKVLLEMQRRNPNANPAALTGVLTNALQLYRTNAPCYIRTNGFPDEVLAAYLDALRQVPARTNFVSANLTLLSLFTLGPDNYDSTPTYQKFIRLFDSSNERLLSTAGDALRRQALVNDCVTRAHGNAAFAAAMDCLLWPEMNVRLTNTAAAIIFSSNSLLYDSPTMTTLLALCPTNGNGSFTVSSNLLASLFTNEMQTVWNISHTNLAVRAQINQGQPNWLAYLANQTAMSNNAQLVAAMQENQPAQLACATAAVLAQTGLEPVNAESAQIEQSVTAGAELATGLILMNKGKPDGCEKVLASGMDIFNMFSGDQSPEDAMAAQLNNVRTLVEDLNTNMNYRFDRVDQSLTTIFDCLNTNFSQNLIMFTNQTHLIAELQVSVDDIRDTLVDVQASINRIESSILFSDLNTAREGLEADMNNYLFWDEHYPLTPMTFQTANFNYMGGEGHFMNYLTVTTPQYPCAPPPGQFPTNSLAVQLMEYPLDINVNYLQSYLRTNLGITSVAGNPGLPNPRDWFMGAYAYLQLAGEQPMWFRSMALDVPQISAMGTNLASFFRSLSFSGTNINWQLYTNLENFYLSNLTNFNAQASSFEHGSAYDTNFALNAWRQWDLAAPHVTATATKVIGVPDIPPAFPRASVAQVAAGAWHALALTTNGTVIGWGDNSCGQIAIPAGLSNVVIIAAGDSNSVALKADRTVVCWGDNTYGQTNVPAGLSNVVAIAAGGRHTLALKADGSVVAWGDNAYNQTNIPAGLNGVMAIAAGELHNLALKTNGTVVAWGAGLTVNYHDLVDYGQSIIPAGLTNVTAIAAGQLHSLALKADGTVVGWGYDYLGQANGTMAAVPPFAASGPVSVAGQILSNVVAIAAGGAHSLALLTNRTACGWGGNNSGQAIGVPSTQVPPFGSGAVKPAGQTASNLVAIAAGGAHSLAIQANGAVAVWGDLTLVPPALNWRRAMAAGAGFQVVLKSDGTVAAWDYNDSGQTTVPSGLTNVVAVATGYSHSLALKADGTVAGWGANNDGQINTNGLSNLVAIAAGGDHSLALKADGTVAAWGDSSYGLTNTAGLSHVVAVAAGFAHSLALKTDGTIAAWGLGNWGQTNVPAGLTNVAAIAAGGWFSVALKPDGTVVSWGDDYFNQTNVPAGLNKVAAIAAGLYHTLALKADGTVVAWGRNEWGITNVPAGLSNVVAIAAGETHSLALKADGTVVRWGDPGFGQTNIPAGLTNVVAIAAQAGHKLALSADGTVVGWGDNTYGQSHVPNGLSNVVTVAAGGRQSLALKLDGTVAGWGDTTAGELNVAGWNNVVAIAAGRLHSLALRADGTVISCGDNSYGQRNTGGWNNVLAIVSGDNHSVALLANGSVVCCGDNTSGQLNAPTLNDAVAIAAAGNHSLALRADGTVVAWGDSAYGLNNTAGLNHVVAIAAGGEHSLALQADGTVVGWGGNDQGQINLPSGLTGVVAMAGDVYDSLLLTTTGTTGSAGNGGIAFDPAPIPLRTTALFESCNQKMIAELGRLGSPLDSAAQNLSGAKLLLEDVLELGMPYTLGGDDLLHGFLYGSESLADTGASTDFLQTQNAQFQAAPDLAPQALTNAAMLRFQFFTNRLSLCLSKLQATGQPEIPRLVSHTLRLLNLLGDAWILSATNSPSPALEFFKASNTSSLLLYGEPNVHCYNVQCSDSLIAPHWTNTAITVRDGQTNAAPFFSGRQGFYRTVLIPPDPAK